MLSAEGLEQALAMISTEVVHIVVLDQRQGEDLAVDILQRVLSELAPVTDLYTDQLLSTVDLQPGMMLTRDLISKEGVLLLGEGEVLDQDTIERIRELEFNFSEFFQLYIELR